METIQWINKTDAKEVLILIMYNIEQILRRPCIIDMKLSCQYFEIKKSRTPSHLISVKLESPELLLATNLSIWHQAYVNVSCIPLIPNVEYTME